MLGRHVYRVHPVDNEWTVTEWTVSKEGETDPRARFREKQPALAEACRLAETDQPSRVVVDNGGGTLVEEHLFGSDLTEEI